MDANRMPGDAEAAAAIAGMSDTYGHACPSVGDQVWWRIEEGTWDTGRVLRILPGVDTKLVVKSELSHDVHVIDVRMWPAGNRLDF